MNSHIFQKTVIIISFAVTSQLLTAQSQLPPDTARVSRQCSLIRELISIGQQSHFATILEGEIGSTRGYRPNGTWEFATVRYSSTMQWPGANLTYL